MAYTRLKEKNTLERAAKLGHDSGHCTIYLGNIKTCNHIFFDCNKAQRAWIANIHFFKHSPVDNTLSYTSSFIDVLNGGLKKMARGTTYLFVIYQTCWPLWLHHNDRVLNDKVNRFSPRINANLATAHLEAATKYTTSHKKWRCMRQALQSIKMH